MTNCKISPFFSSSSSSHMNFDLKNRQEILEHCRWHWTKHRWYLDDLSLKSKLLWLVPKRIVTWFSPFFSSSSFFSLSPYFVYTRSFSLFLDLFFFFFFSLARSLLISSALFWPDDRSYLCEVKNKSERDLEHKSRYFKTNSEHISPIRKRETKREKRNYSYWWSILGNECCRLRCRHFLPLFFSPAFVSLFKYPQRWDSIFWQVRDERNVSALTLGDI